jgi:membrane fusion protein (multidrug efflux system)
MNDMASTPVAAEAVIVTADPVLRGSKRKRLFALLASVVAIAAIAFGIYYYFARQGRVSTDNAYVGADVAQITALVSGPVREVRVGGTQTVKVGDVLVILDDADARIEVATAQAALTQAQQRFGQSTASVQAARARIAARGADVAQARARLTDANAQVERARIELARRQSLAGTGAVSGSELTEARAALSSAQATRESAAAQITAAQATQASAAGDAAASEAAVQGVTASTAPDVASARARLDAAQLALARTVIRAPIDGIVSNRQVQIGQRIAAGAPIMTLVPLATAYVDANFKESQFNRIREGQPVALTSDFYGDNMVFHGRVSGFAGATGAATALIPAQNATGNWIKVVQRLPVRITLDPRELKAHPLRTGLSMTATVDTRGR